MKSESPQQQHVSLSTDGTIPLTSVYLPAFQFDSNGSIRERQGRQTREDRLASILTSALKLIEEPESERELFPESLVESRQ